VRQVGHLSRIKTSEMFGCGNEKKKTEWRKEKEMGSVMVFPLLSLMFSKEDER